VDTRQRVIALVAVLAIITVLVSCRSKATVALAPTNSDGPYRVVKVWDGDTFDLVIDGKTDRVRIIGYNSPETKFKVECGGKKASQYAFQELSSNKVYLERDMSTANRDKYQRLLRHVWIDRELFALKAIELGYGREFTYRGQLYKYRDNYREAQRFAQVNSKGIWAKQRKGGCQ